MIVTKDLGVTEIVLTWPTQSVKTVCPSSKTLRIVVLNLSPHETEKLLLAAGSVHLLCCGDDWPSDHLLKEFHPDLIICGNLGLSWVVDHRICASVAAADSSGRCTSDSPGENAEVFSSLAEIVARKTVRLKTRHRQVLLCLYKGLTNAEIGRHLGVSTRTVKGYLTELFIKFDVTNRTELVGLISDMRMPGTLDELPDGPAIAAAVAGV